MAISHGHLSTPALAPPMQSLEGKVAVVTGAGSGIGREIARALAAAGSHVVVAEIEQDAAAEVADELERTGVDSIMVRCDVSDRGQVEALATAAWERFRHADIMVNNAGVMGRNKRCIDADERDARWMFDVNVFGTWYGCSAFGKRFPAPNRSALRTIAVVFDGPVFPDHLTRSHKPANPGGIWPL